MVAKLNFQLSLLYSSMSHDPSKIILNSLESTVSPRYQLGFFKISAKDTKNTLLILVKQISIIYQSKLLSVYFYLRTLTITTKLCSLGKKKENKQGALSVFSVSTNCF